MLPSLADLGLPPYDYGPSVRLAIFFKPFTCTDWYNWKQHRTLNSGLELRPIVSTTLLRKAPRAADPNSVRLYTYGLIYKLCLVNSFMSIAFTTPPSFSEL